MVGIGGGYYITDDGPTKFYSGADNNRFSTLFNANTRVYQTILNDLGGYPFALQSGPSDIIYKNAGSFELTVAYQLRNGWSLNLGFQAVRLDVSGVFTLLVDRTNPNGNPEPFLELGEIRARERRSHLLLTVGKSFDLKEDFYFKSEAGLDFNFVEPLSHQVNIAGRDHNILFLNQSQLLSNTTTSGGGVYFSGALGYQISGSYGLYLKTSYFFTLIDVNNVSEALSHIFVPSLGFTKQF